MATPIRSCVTSSLGITDARAARRLIGAITGDDPSLPQITTGAHWGPTAHRRTPLNVGFTFPGLAALAVPASDLASFPSDFRDGAAARAAKIGDTGASAPCHWRGGLGEKGVAHAIVTIYAADEVVLDDVTAALLDAGRGAIVEVSRFDGATFPDGVVHFGYRDGISQPRMEGLREDAEPDDQPLTPTGSLVLGYPEPVREPRLHRFRSRRCSVATARTTRSACSPRTSSGSTPSSPTPSPRPGSPATSSPPSCSVAGPTATR